jgi:ATP-binding cassette, subfamily C, bacterial
MIDKAEAAVEPLSGTKSPVLGAGCTFEKVSFAHGKQPTVKDLNFIVPANKITVLQGPSGAGKTTIIDLLVGFHRPQSGIIRIGNDDLNDVNIIEWRKSIGYVPQELVLFHDTVLANISLSDLTVTETQVKQALVRAGAGDFINTLPEGLMTDVGEMGGKLSGGQKQRISLARALVKNPKILILDEVTSALDPKTEAEIVRNIVDLSGAYTIIAITHRPAWTEIADKLYKVEDGCIIELKRTKTGTRKK